MEERESKGIEGGDLASYQAETCWLSIVGLEQAPPNFAQEGQRKLPQVLSDFVQGGYVNTGNRGLIGCSQRDEGWLNDVIGKKVPDVWVDSFVPAKIVGACLRVALKITSSGPNPFLRHTLVAPRFESQLDARIFSGKR